MGLTKHWIKKKRPRRETPPQFSWGGLLWVFSWSDFETPQTNTSFLCIQVTDRKRVPNERGGQAELCESGGPVLSGAGQLRRHLLVPPAPLHMLTVQTNAAAPELIDSGAVILFDTSGEEIAPKHPNLKSRFQVSAQTHELTPCLDAGGNAGRLLRWRGIESRSLEHCRN